MEYLRRSIDGCKLSDQTQLKSVVHRNVTRMGVLAASLTKNCFQKVYLKNSIMQNLVREVEVDQELTSLAHVQAALTEPDATPTWHLQRLVNQTLDTPFARESQVRRGKGVHLYTIDAGVRVQHTEFENANRPTKFLVTPDQSEECMSALRNDESDRAFGTAAAALAAGKTFGLADEATLIPVRAFACQGNAFTAHVSGLIEALDMVHHDHVVAHGRNATSVAVITVGAPFSRILNQVATQLVKDGITVVAASGHSSVFPQKSLILEMSEATSDACFSSPASALGVISVGATLQNNTVAPFTTTGHCVTLYAPGSNVHTAGNDNDSKTQVTSGTGAAAAIVAGLAATFLGANQGAPPHLVREYLLSTSRSEPALTTAVSTVAPSASKFSPPHFATFNNTALAPQDVCKKSATYSCVHGLSFFTQAPTARGQRPCECVCEPGYTGKACDIALNATSIIQPKQDVITSFQTVAPLAASLNASSDLPGPNSAMSPHGGIDQPGFPLNSVARYQRMQSLYLASELQTAGFVANSVLSGLAFRVFTPIANDIDDVIISIGFVPSSTTKLSTFVPTVQVFRGKISAATSAAANSDALVAFSFQPIGGTDLPKWDGQSNLVVEYAAKNLNLPTMLQSSQATWLGSGAVYTTSVADGFGRTVFAYSMDNPDTGKDAEAVYPFTELSKVPISSRLLPVIRLKAHAPNSKCLSNGHLEVKCGYKGVCDDSTGKCRCAHGFKGDHCDEIDPITNPLCVPNFPAGYPAENQQPKCQNSGLCVQGTCECINGFFGSTCSHAPRSFCDAHPGYCGDHGTCVDNGACVCKPEYVGSRCQVEKPGLIPHTQSEQKCVNLNAFGAATLAACQVAGVNETEKFNNLAKLSCALYGGGSSVSEECTQRVLHLIDCVHRVTNTAEAYPDSPNLVASVKKLIELRAKYAPGPHLTVTQVQGKPVSYAFGPTFNANATAGARLHPTCIDGFFRAPSLKVTSVTKNTKLDELDIGGIDAGELVFIRETEHSCGEVRSLLNATVLPPNVKNFTIEAKTPATSSEPAVGKIANFSLSGAPGAYVPCYAHSPQAPFALIPGVHITELDDALGASNLVSTIRPNSFELFSDNGHRDILIKHTAPDSTALFGRRIGFSLANKCGSTLQHEVYGFLTPPRLNPLEIGMPGASGSSNADLLNAITSYASVRIALPFGVTGKEYSMCVLGDDADVWEEQQDNATHLRLGKSQNPDGTPSSPTQKCNLNCGMGDCINQTCVCKKLYRQSLGTPTSPCDTPPPAVPAHGVRARFQFKVPAAKSEEYIRENSDGTNELKQGLAHAAEVPSTRFKFIAARIISTASFLEVEEAIEDLRVAFKSSPSFIALLERVYMRDATADVEIFFDIHPPSENDPNPKDALQVLNTISSKGASNQGLNLGAGVSLNMVSPPAAVCPDGSDPAVTHCGTRDWCEENVSMSCVWFGVLMGSIAVLIVTAVIVLVFCTGKEEEFVPAVLSGQSRPAGRAVLEDEDDDDGQVGSRAEKRTLVNSSTRSDGSARSRR